MSEYSMKKAVGLTAVAKYSTVLFQLIFSAILSRILTPDEFGTVAVVMVFIAFFQMFSDMGFAAAVIQDKTLTKNETNNIFTFTIFMGLFLMVAFGGFSFLIANLYNDHIYVPLGLLLSISIFFNTINTIPNAILLKNKRFGTITIRTVAVQLTTSLFTIFLAFRGLGVYALVLQSILSSILIFAWNEINAKLSFYIQGMKASLKKEFSYSIFQFGAMSLNYFNRNLDNLLIGKFFSPEQLGYYNKSYHLMGMPISYIPGVINPTLQPILSDHHDNPKYIYDRYVRILHILSFLGCLVAALFIANAKEIILLLFGSQWEVSVMPLRLLAISLGPQLMTNTIGVTFQSLGNTKMLFNVTVLTTTIICSCIVFGSFLGDINYVAMMVSVAYVITFFISYYVLIKMVFKYSYRTFLKSFKGDFTAYILLILVALLLPNMTDSHIVNFITKTGVISACFLISTYLNGSLLQFKELMLPSLSRRKRPQTQTKI